MWKNSLVSISKKACKARIPFSIAKETQQPLQHKIDKPFSLPNSSATLSSNANRLLSLSTEYQNQLQQSNFYTSLSDHSLEGQTCENEGVLLRNAEALPLTYATESFCILLNAGQVNLAIQLASFWQYKVPKNPVIARRKAKAFLKNSIRTLQQIKDTTTMIALIEMLSDALKEQVDHEKITLQTHALHFCHKCPESIQFKLFAPLGVRTTSELLYQALMATCTAEEIDVTSMMEKLVLMDRAATPQNGYAALLDKVYIPFPLYRFWGQLEASPAFDSSFIEDVCPNLPSKLVHPAEYDIVDILGLSKRDALYIHRNWEAQSIFGNECHENNSTSRWRRVKSQVSHHSKMFEKAEENAVLISILARKSVTHGESDLLKKRLRKKVTYLLKASSPALRRYTAFSLLRRKDILKELQISPIPVAAVYAQSFFSKNTVSPMLCRLCSPVIKQCCILGQYKEAARVAWNHLSVNCECNTKLFRSQALLFDYVTVSISKAMFCAVDSGAAQPWMGYRSLALLRIAASSTAVTPLHCVPVCVAALGCGTPFAAISETLAYVFPEKSQQRWVLDLVRVCSEVDVKETYLNLDHPSISTSFKSMVSRLSSGQKTKKGDSRILVESPSRSKQIALWSLVNEENSNTRLTALIVSAFLSESVRGNLLNCDYILAKDSAALPKGNTSTKEACTLTDAYYWEVAASIASNCTTDDSFRTLLNALISKKPSCLESDRSLFDSTTALLYSELGQFEYNTDSLPSSL